MSEIQLRASDSDAVKYIAARASDLLALLPAGKSERFVDTLVNHCRTNTDLAQADPKTVLQAAYAAARAGLIVGTGDAYIVRYGTQAQLQISFKGLQRLAHLSGHAVDIGAFDVHEADEFEPYLDGFSHFKRALKDRGPYLGTAAYAKLRNGEMATIFLDAEAMNKRQQFASKGKRSTPWNEWTVEMRYKTAVRYLIQRGKVLLDPDASEAVTMQEAQWTVQEARPQRSYRAQLTTTPAPDEPLMLDGEIPVIDLDADTTEEVE